MTKVRFFLVLLAIAMIALVLEFSRANASATPESLLADARAELDPENAEPDYDAALMLLEHGLTLALAAGDREARRTLQLEHARAFRTRWERARASPDEQPDPTDLHQVIDECIGWLTAFEEDDPEVLRLAARSALDSDQPVSALGFLQRLEAVTERDTDIDLLSAHSHLLYADEILSEVRASMRELLPRRTADELYVSARRIASRPPEDARRAADLELLALELPASARGAIVDRISKASGNLGTAAARFLRVLDAEPNGIAVTGLQRILIDAGANTKAIELAQLSLRSEDLTERELVVRTAVVTLLGAGRVTPARRLVQNLFDEEDYEEILAPLRHDELYEWAEILHRLEAWPQLHRVASLVIERNANTALPDERTQESNFYRGVAASHLERIADAYSFLNRVSFQRREELPGMHLEGWEALARVELALGKPRDARFALNKATRAAPLTIDDPRLARVAGRAWFSLGQLDLVNGDSGGAEHALTHALRLLPDRREEITPRWEEAGQEAMKARERSPDFIADNPLLKTPDGKYPEMGPWEAVLRADASLERGFLLDAPVLLQPVLDGYPGFPPALEALAASEVLRGNFRRAIRAQLELAEIGYFDASGFELLRSVPPSRFLGRDLRRWMFYDPLGAGFVVALEDLLAKGQDELALLMLEAAPTAQLSHLQLQVGARAADRLGRPQLAFSYVWKLPPGSPAFERNAALGLRLSAEVVEALGEPEALIKFVQALLGSVEPIQLAGNLDLPRAVDVALTTGRTPPLQELLRVAESVPSSSRGAFLLRLAVTHILDGSHAAALTTLDRAEPLLDDDSALFGRLLVALESGDEARLSRLAVELMGSPLSEDPVRRVAFALLADNTRPAREALDELDGREDPRLPLLERMVRANTPDEEGDGAVAPTVFADADAAWSAVPRPVLLSLLAGADLEGFEPWVLLTLRELTKEVRQTPIGALLQVLSWRSLGRTDRMERVLRAAIQLHDDLALWLAREELLRERAAAEPLGTHGRAHTELLAHLSERFRRFGDAGASAREIALVSVLEAGREGDLGAARETLLREAERNPEDFVFALEFARATAASGDPHEAIESYERLFLAHPELSRPYVVEVVEVLTASLAAESLTEAACWAELDALQALYPEDPALPRALVELRLGSSDQPTDSGVQSAWDHLARFRERTDQRSVESLRAGEAGQWALLFRRFDPQGAEDFARAELDQAPGSLDLWTIWCDALIANGRSADALDAYDALGRLVPSQDLFRARALLRLDLGRAPGKEAATLLASEEVRKRYPDLALRCAIGLYERGDRDSLDEALELFEGGVREKRPMAVLGRRLALAIHQDDPDSARRILTALSQVTRDPLDVMLLRATRNLLGFAD